MTNDDLFPIVETFSLFGEPLFQLPLLPEFGYIAVERDLKQMDVIE